MECVKQEYWDNSYKKLKYRVAKDEVTDFLDLFIQNTSSLEAFEVGCYPARYLSHIGKKGYKVNGIDMTPKVETDLKKWLKSLNIKTGDFIKGDFCTLKNNVKYDLVYSIGFIEHFHNFLDVIDKHDKILKNEGLLIITAPNFKGKIQNMLHKYLDRENLNRHYTPSMDPQIWEEYLKKMNYEVIFSGYFGKIDFWVDNEKRSLLKKIGLKIIFLILKLLKTFKWFIKDNESYSPYCGIVAIKK